METIFEKCYRIREGLADILAEPSHHHHHHYSPYEAQYAAQQALKRKEREEKEAKRRKLSLPTTSDEEKLRLADELGEIAIASSIRSRMALSDLGKKRSAEPYIPPTPREPVKKPVKSDLTKKREQWIKDLKAAIKPAKLSFSTSLTPEYLTAKIREWRKMGFKTPEELTNELFGLALRTKPLDMVEPEKKGLFDKTLEERKARYLAIIQAYDAAVPEIKKWNDEFEARDFDKRFRSE